ncbi:MAG: lipopolysaccharide heptosyltransferase I [Methylophilaceae bacterium]|nr:lipopolysaccharide heptosyltransferase I [Methylophilaceae bacterium]MDG1820372.1 lipopolysaccharide heptosyltransferase I [Methylophilaceae bacterium]
MKRILLIKTSSLGDVIHNLPVVNDILKHHPDAHIDWVVEESFADIPRHHPNVQSIFTVAVRRWRKQLFHKKTWQEIRAFKQQMALQPYDLVIDTQGLLKSAILCTFAKGTKIGMDKHSAREAIASYCYNQTYAIARQQHAVERNRALVAHACGYAPPVDQPHYGITATATSTIKLPTPFVIGLHATSKQSKLWPTPHWIALAKALAERNLSLVLPWANHPEQTRAHQIAENQTNVLVLPKLTIAHLASVIQQAKLAIGVDTGLSHLSAALNIPTVALYTDTHPSRTGVMASAHSKAINLGGKHQIPSVTAVLEAMQAVT